MATNFTNKNISSIQLKEEKYRINSIPFHATEAEWNSTLASYVPKQGEIIVYDIDNSHTQPRVKVGDGIKIVKELGFSATEAYVDNSLNEKINDVILTEDGILKQDVLPSGYPYTALGSILPLTTLTVAEEDGGMTYILDNFPIVSGYSYTVTWNGEEYSCVAQTQNVDGLEGVALGNMAAFGGEESSEPFAILYLGESMVQSMGIYGIVAVLDGSTEINISIDGIIIQKIDKGFLPESNLKYIVDGANFGSIRAIGTFVDTDEYVQGVYSTTFGLSTKASGQASHAEGEGTTASGDGSHAEGNSTTASGQASHAEGNSITASGNYSHAEGSGTTASGNSSHAEGEGTTASGNYSHAEGRGTTASGVTSHVQGRFNIEDTENKYAHIVGNGRANARSNAHTLDWDGVGWFKGGLRVGGTSQNDAKVRYVALKDEVVLKNDAVGKNVAGQTFIIDDKTIVAGIGAEVFNDYLRNIASGDYSHAEGNDTTASGMDSHAEGFNTTASGDYSHAEGNDTTASGNYSHAEGFNTTASESVSHAEGSGTTASGSSSHAEGFNTTAFGNYSHAEGRGTTASNNSSHAEGNGTIASGINQHVEGSYNIEDTENKYAHIVGNGYANSGRSNAHTLDWDGNAWFKGEVKIGGTSYDSIAAKTLATTDAIPTKVSELTNDSGFITSAPVKGTDYWTEADQEAIVQQVIAALGTPVFGRVDADNTIILSGDLADGTYTIKYEDAEGNVTEIGTLNNNPGPTYTNVLPLAKGEDGNPYNGTGYAVGKRINSSWNETAVSTPTATNPVFLTGRIPIPAGATVRFKNCYIDTNGVNGSANDTADKAYYGHNLSGLYGCLLYYNATSGTGNKAGTNYTWNNFVSYSNLASAPTVDSNGYVTEFTFNTTETLYARFVLGGDPATAIITINEEIID